MDDEVGQVTASGPFEGGQMHGDGCEWRLANGHVYFRGSMENGFFTRGERQYHHTLSWAALTI